MESKCDEGKSCEGKRSEGPGKRSGGSCKWSDGSDKRSEGSGPGASAGAGAGVGGRDVKKLANMMAKREQGDVLANLFPFYQSKIAHGMDEFFDEYCGEFDYDSDENRLVYTDIFRKYEALFDSYLSEFVEQQHLDAATFYAELNALVQGARPGRSQVLVRMLAAQTDYYFFVSLMKDKARERDSSLSTRFGGNSGCGTSSSGGGGGASRLSAPPSTVAGRKAFKK
jgi:hypothetical protein